MVTRMVLWIFGRNVTGGGLDMCMHVCMLLCFYFIIFGWVLYRLYDFDCCEMGDGMLGVK